MSFSITPIGGVEEIGSNMTLVSTPSEDIIIDCGLLFPYEECFDINYVCPNFKQLDVKKVSSLVITHGHEDHIGALPQFLAHFPNVTIYVTNFTLKLIQKKLAELNISFNFKIYNSASKLLFSDIDIFPVHVNHSIPETHGLIIQDKNKDWGALYISDFKIDLHATHEPPIDLNKIQTLLSECKKTAYFIDSTNILFDGKTPSENDLNYDLSQLINSSNDRIFITLFASNIHRLNFIAQIALHAGRKIVLLGRSIRHYFESAFESGLTSLDPEKFLDGSQASSTNEKILVFVSGCQGDFLSALRRFSYGEDTNFKPGPNDLVIFSSKVIPGNEKKIYRIYNKLSEFGAQIITASDALIHASGHPGKDDLKILLSNFAPSYYFPIHGESYLLRKHFEYIKEHFPQVQPQLIYNFSQVKFFESKIEISASAKIEPILIHGKNLEIERSQISQRRKMATQGAVFLTYLKKSKKLEITLIGLPLSASDLLENLKKKLIKQIDNDLSGREDKYFTDQLKISTRQFFNNFLGYKPITELHLIDG